jgi:hypothetical protein
MLPTGYTASKVAAVADADAPIRARTSSAVMPEARAGVEPLVVIAASAAPMRVLTSAPVIPVAREGTEPLEVIAETLAPNEVFISAWVAVTAPVTLGNVAFSVALISRR